MICLQVFRSMLSIPATLADVTKHKKKADGWGSLRTAA